MKKVLFCMSVVGFFALGFLGSARAEILVFNVQANSNLTLSGNAIVNVNGVDTPLPYQQQAAGTLVTSFLGTITVDVNNLFSPGSITFLSANLDANLNSVASISPGLIGVPGAAPADYGVSIPAIGGVGALRDIVFNMSAASTAVSAGSFAVSGQSWSYRTGNFDVNSPGGLGRVDLLVGNPFGLNAGALGSYTVNGNVATLVLPTSVSIAYNDGLVGTNRYTGTITAIAAVPEPSSIALLGLCGVGGLVARLRKRKSRV